MRTYTRGYGWASKKKKINKNKVIRKKKMYTGTYHENPIFHVGII